MDNTKVANIIRSVKAAKHLTAEWNKHSFFFHVGRHVVIVVYKPDDVRNGYYCSCEWSHYGGDGCKHVIAVAIRNARKIGRSATFYLNEELARSQKQMWDTIAPGLYVVYRAVS